MTVSFNVGDGSNQNVENSQFIDHNEGTAIHTQINHAVVATAHEKGIDIIESFSDKMPQAEAIGLKEDWKALKPVIDKAEADGEVSDAEAQDVEGFFKHLVNFTYEKRWEIVEGFVGVFTPLPQKLVSIPGRYLEEKLTGKPTGEA